MKSTQLAFNPMRMGHFDYLFPQCTNLKYSVKCALYYLYKKDYSQVQEDEPNFFYSWIVTKMLYPELKDSEVEKRAQNTTTEQDEINRGIVYMLQSLTTINKKIASCSKDPSTKVEDKTLDAYEFILNKFNGRLEKYLETSDLDKNLLQPIFEAAKMAAGNVKTAIETYRALQSRKPATPEEIKARCTGFSDKQISGSVYNQGGSPYSGTNSNSFHNNGHKVNVTAAIKAKCTGSDKQIPGNVYDQGRSPYSGTNSNSFHNNGHKVKATAAIKAKCTGSDKQIPGNVYDQGRSPYSGTNSNSFHNNGHKVSVTADEHKVNVTADEHKKNLLNKSSQSVWKL